MSREDTAVGTETTTLLSMLSASEARTLSTLTDFNKTLARKWEATCERNLSPDVYVPEGLWKKANVLDPFMKSGQSQNFNNYISMFELVISP